MKPFNLKEAKAGKPVCTKDGCKARIICFDSTTKNYPLVVLIEGDTGEYPYVYTAEGKFDQNGKESTFDLMMLPEKKEGYINLYKGQGIFAAYTSHIYKSREDTESSADLYVVPTEYIKTIKIEWEE